MLFQEFFFVPRITNKFVKLWACSRCNKKLKALDDEYVTRFLQLTSFNSSSRMGVERFLDGVKKGSGTLLDSDALAILDCKR